ncbi:MAG: dephospho-CoA kinase [Acidimicrobiia bacterium]
MTEPRHIRVVLSGGIGTGKSTVAEILKARGIPVIHADMIGHAVLEPEGEAFPAVAARWPEVVQHGRVDRQALAAIVFEHPQALAELESMTHPAIAARILNLVAAESGTEIVVVELPLLLPILGAGWVRVVVDAPLGDREQRLLARGMESADLQARMGAQPSEAEWREAADYLVSNHGSPEDLEEEVDRLLAWMRKS